jgi:hypothetical protein
MKRLLHDTLVDLCTLPLLLWWRVRAYLAVRQDDYLHRRWLEARRRLREED